MSQNWQVIYYETLQGNSPIYDFIEHSNTKNQAKIANTLDLLEQYGVNLGFPHIKKLTNSHLWELRILGTDNIRIFYVAKTGRIFLLLHAFAKKKQKTDKKEIKIAIERLKEYDFRKKL